MEYKYAYLTGTMIGLFVWLVLYYHRKDLRREMWAMSIASALGSVITAHYFWTKDWWRPDTITGTLVGIEDFILGFAVGGMAAVIYEEIFHKRLYKFNRKQTHNKGALFYALIIIVVMSVFYKVFNYTSFWASTIAFGAGGLYLMWFRRDLIVAALVKGILMVLVSMPIYYAIIFFWPGWVDDTYLFETLSGTKVTGIPIEELVFWFLFGFGAGPYYEYWQGYRLRNLPKNK